MTGMPASSISRDLRRDPHAALQLDRLRAALLHQPDGGGQRLLGPGLVAAERHVGDDQRARGAADDGPGQSRMSSTVTGTVTSWPRTTLPAESPTSRTGMPASSKTRRVYAS